MSDLVAGGETEQLILEFLRVEHADHLFLVFCDPLVCRALQCSAPASLEEFEENFRRRIAGPMVNREQIEWINYAVRLKGLGRYVGRVEAVVNRDRSAGNWSEVGYVFGSADWGRGYAAESLEWLHQDLKRNFQATEFWATTSAANERSQRLLLRAGYQSTRLRDDRPLASYDPGDEVYFRRG